MITREEYDEFIKLQERYLELEEKFEREFLPILNKYVISDNKPDWKVHKWMDRIVSYGEDVVRYKTNLDDDDMDISLIAVDNLLSQEFRDTVDESLRKYSEAMEEYKAKAKANEIAELKKRLERLEG